MMEVAMYCFPSPKAKSIPYRSHYNPSRWLRVLSAAAILGTVPFLPPRSLEAQTHTAELVLRPSTARVSVKASGRTDWTPAARMQGVGAGDSIHVTRGSAELFFRTGRRVLLPAGTKTLAGDHAATETGGVATPLVAAIQALFSMGRGDSERPSKRRVSLEARLATAPANSGNTDTGLGTLRRIGGRVIGGERVLGREADAMRPGRDEAPVILLPEGSRFWNILDGTHALRWSSHDPWVPTRLRIYPAQAQDGCPPDGRAVLDTLVTGDSLTFPVRTALLAAGGRYRVELGNGPIRIGCMRVVTPAEAAEVEGLLKELRAEFGAVRAAAADDALRVFEAALLAEKGFEYAAIETLIPLRRTTNPTATRLLNRVIESVEPPAGGE